VSSGKAGRLGHCGEGWWGYCAALAFHDSPMRVSIGGWGKGLVCAARALVSSLRRGGCGLCLRRAPHVLAMSTRFCVYEAGRFLLAPIRTPPLSQAYNQLVSTMPGISVKKSRERELLDNAGLHEAS
jgi:hypothetical protein